MRPSNARRGVRWVVAALLTSAACASAGGAPPEPTPAPVPPEPRDVVVLVHGMGRTPLSMLPLAYTLDRAGFQVVNWGYSSTCCRLDELATRLAEDVREAVDPASGRVHFVGHSLGNIIIRRALAEDDRGFTPGRVVMLAPPNQGAASADRYVEWLGWLLPPLHDLATEGLPVSGVERDAQAEVAVIAARGDGKVAVAETILPGMDEHIVVDGGHTFIMMRGDVRAMVLRYLREGALP